MLNSFSSDFIKAMKIIFDWEGKVIHHDKDDPGGLTACGISKVHYPKWIGWEYIDELKIGNKAYQAELLKDGSEFMNLVYGFYYDTLWTKYGGNFVPYIVAFEIFDQAINPGPKRMVENLQNILNSLNYEERFGKDLKDDGLWGNNTRDRLLLVCKNKKDAESLAIGMNAEQGHYYHKRTLANKRNRKYYRGWINRTIVQR